MKETVIYKKNPEMLSRDFDSEMILIPTFKTSKEINCIYSLNKAATRIWGYIDGKRTMRQIVDKTLKDFDTSESKASAVMEKLFADLVKIKAITK